MGGNDGDVFSIDSSTGEIKVTEGAMLDYEVKSSYELMITVNDGLNTSQAELVTVDLNNLNDTKPVVFASHVFHLDENSGLETGVGTVEATDLDGPTSFTGWEISSGNTGSAFGIHPETGAITVVNSSALDYEAIQSFQLGISVSDGVNRSEVEIVTIELNNLNDTAPEIAENQQFTIQENRAAGFHFGAVMSSDADGETTFSDWMIVSGDGAEAFAIDPSNGELMLADPSLLDFEGVRTYTVVVQVSDGMQTTRRSITITIENENDNVPTDIKLSENAFKESVDVGSLIGVLSTDDLDGIDFHTYTLVDGDGSSGNVKFRIEDGQLFTNAEFNFDYEKSHTIRVRSTDSGGQWFDKVFALNILQDGDIDLAIPTAFSPNGDFVNDTWELDRLDSYPGSIVKVFNSDGVEVFSTTGNAVQWDGRYKGKDLAFGTYYYVIRLNGLNGRTYKGFVMLIK
jgi:gliding motility-associated-like protein